MKFKYSVTQLFTYTGVSKVRIFIQIIRYAFFRLFDFQYVTTNVNHYRMKLDLKTPGLSKVLFIYGSRELPDIFVVNQVLQKGMVVADIGANIGYYTLLEAQNVGPTGHVHAFEPDPRNIPLLRDNVRLNDFTDCVTVYEQAVSDRRERKFFQLNERTNVSSFVDRADMVGGVDVDCIALYEFEHIDKVDMLRMDAEGYECKIIEGAMPFLRKNDKPFYIMLELHPAEYNETDLNFNKTLTDLEEIGFTPTYVIAGVRNRNLFAERGYIPVNTWQETRHTRDLYQNVTMRDFRTFFERGSVRSVMLSRDGSAS